MKQCIVLFLCVIMVMLAGYVMQKENVLFGPAAVLVDPLSLEPENVPEMVPESASAPKTGTVSYSEDELREANAGAKRQGNQQPR